MQICSDGHDEMCFAGDTCPACQFKSKIQEADEECSAALATIDELKGTIDALNDRLDEKLGHINRMTGWRL